MTEISTERLEEEMAAVAGTINLAARAVERGDPVDLTALAKRVEWLCAALVTLPATDAREIGAGLPAITEILDGIARTLLDRGAGAGPITPDSPKSHDQAARAYGAALSRGRR